jgi:hypothetical protein
MGLFVEHGVLQVTPGTVDRHRAFTVSRGLCYPALR